MRVPVTIGEIGAALRGKKLSARELTEETLRRVADANPRLNAFLTVTEAEARVRAAAVDDDLARGIDRGPLQGIPIAHKDNIFTRGVRTTSGSKIFADFVPEYDAAIVSQFNDAGAVMIGKTGLHEFAYGVTSNNPHFGAVRNPWDLERIPGGSSGGSAAAVAAGLIPLATGTDTGGSVRIPAGLCNLVGLKTTQGLISRHGLVELCPTHDTVGPLARTVEDAAILLDVMSGPDPLDPASAHAPSRRISDQIRLPVEGLRLWALPDSERAGVESAVLDCYDRALQVLASRGVQLVYRDLPRSCVEYMGIAGSLMSAEGYSALGPLFEREDLEFDQNVRRRILLGRDISSADYLALLKERQNATNEMYAAMDGIDVCAFPTNPISAIPLVDVDELATPLSRFGRFVNLLNLASVAVPCGFTRSGLPISIQFIGRPLHESLVMRVGHAYERATTWHQQVPQGLM